MRHGKKINHLGRTAAHRQALLSNLASSLILNKRISTTVAKAKALRKYVEPLLTKSKEDTTHSRRTAFSYLQNKESVKELFGEVASKIGERPGGYTRIIKLSDTRLGDNAEMCYIELVDFNTLYTKEGAAKKAKTRRGRRTKKSEDAVEAAEAPAASAPAEGSAEPEAAEKPAKKKASKKKDNDNE
jgi:large subunit ribosomal protein L17